MTRDQRRRHLWLWAVIGPACMLGLIGAILARKPIPVQPMPTASPAPAGASSP